MIKRFIITLLLCIILTTLTVPAFATNYYEYEPNNGPSIATYMMPGNAYYGNLDTGDIDYYLFTQPTAGTQMVYFIPPDNQTYYVGIYDYHILGQSASALAWRTVSNSQGNPVLLTFTREADKVYWVMVLGTNTTPTDDYILIPILQ